MLTLNVGQHRRPDPGQGATTGALLALDCTNDRILASRYAAASAPAGGSRSTKWGGRSSPEGAFRDRPPPP